MSYVHVSWLSPEELKEARLKKEVFQMCRCCGNTNPSKMDCPNCDIAFEEYIELTELAQKCPCCGK